VTRVNGALCRTNSRWAHELHRPSLIRSTSWSSRLTSRTVGGVIAVVVAAPSLQGAGNFHLGAATAGETAPGYFGSTACSISPPEGTVSLGGTGQILIGAAGYPTP
jgi:hypothetical protein